MNSFALLQDEVEDDGASLSDVSPNQTPSTHPVATDAPTTTTDTPAEGSTDPVSTSDPAAAGDPATASSNASSQTPPPQPKERSLTLEEYLRQKAAKSSAVDPLNTRAARQANDGGSAFASMSVLHKKKNAVSASAAAEASDEDADQTVLVGVPIKADAAPTKTPKDSTHVAVASNAQIHKFFRHAPNNNAPNPTHAEHHHHHHHHHHPHPNSRRPRTERGAPRGGAAPLAQGRPRAGPPVNHGPDRPRHTADRPAHRQPNDRPRGSSDFRGGRGRGGRPRFRPYDSRRAPHKPDVVAPNVDDISAFPAL